MVDRAPISRALISVSDKTGVVELAVKLQQLGIEILSTAGFIRVFCGDPSKCAAGLEEFDWSGLFA